MGVRFWVLKQEVIHFYVHSDNMLAKYSISWRIPCRLVRLGALSWGNTLPLDANAVVETVSLFPSNAEPHSIPHKGCAR